MAKKNLKYYIPGAIALVFGIAAFCMMFLEAVKYTADLLITETSYSYTGMQIAFGYKETMGSGALSVQTTILNFNFLALLAFLLPVIGGVLALVFKNGLITKIVTTACFVAGAVLIFSIVGYAGMGMSDAQKALVENLTPTLCAGPIVGGILSALGAFVCLFKGTIAKAIK
ncbi:MAG TPA: hypothetical protein H9726_04960 [Candidatus Borkfalkia avicola]|uniref:Uncharacterized protein n=1 Tax=Candidatus Borkfalkia avicola TaxID=2838503 RepID=A0A9D2IIQ5_9FIRM|nr:hypothetical protein [Candidatus Borkfalkia avicola]